MFKENFDGLAGNNDEEYLRHFGFTVEDLSFLISPQSSLSPIKKKQRNVFNFDGFDGDIEKSAPNSARDPPVPGPYPANYPTVYEHNGSYVKEEPLEKPAPSFDKLELGDLAYMDEHDMARPLTNSSMLAQAGSGASSIATEYAGQEDLQAAFTRNGSSMGLGSLAFSTMSSFNFEDADTDELANFRRAEQQAENERSAASVNSIMNMNLGPGIAGGNPYIGYNKHMVPPLPSLGNLPMPPAQASLMCLEDASFIISAQQQQLFQQQQLLEQQQRALSAAAGNWQHPGSESSLSYSNSESGSQSVSRIGSFKSTLPPLSVDMNALNAAHHAHQQAKLLQQTQGHHFNNGNHSMNSNNNSAYSIMYPQSTASSASNRSSNASSPERFSYNSDSNSGAPYGHGHVKKESGGSTGNGGRAYLTPRDERTSSSGGTPSGTGKDKGGDKDKEDSRASKSLATISRRFVEHFGEANTFDYISGQLHVNDVHDGPAVTNRVDGAAEVLGVHVRRIYELIKILEILSLVTFTGDKRGKFSWRGTKDFLLTLGAIQADGVQKYPDIAYANGLRLVATPAAASAVPSALTSTNSTPINASAFSFGNFPFGNSQDAGADGGRGLHLPTMEGIANCDSDSIDAFEKNSLSGGQYSLNCATEDMEVNIDSIDFSHGSNVDDSRQSEHEHDLDGAELDAFVHLIAADSMLDQLSSANAAAASAAAATAAAPKYSKKRTAVKKGSKASVTAPEPNTHHEEFMVEGICKSFLQLFLIGLDSLSMNFAIQKLVPMEPGQTLSEYNKVNATKIRRVYDVANVLCSLSLINKIMSQKGKGGKGEVGTPESGGGGGHHSRDSSSVARDMFKNGNGNGRADGAKADSKVLEWGSFPPSVIREFYLGKMH